MNAATISEYDQQAADFLAKFGLKFRATLSNSKPAPWSDAGDYRTVGQRTARRSDPAHGKNPLAMSQFERFADSLRQN